MGPAATVDFLAKIIAATPAQRDQDHVPVVVWSDPRIPERNAAILDPAGNPSPVAALRHGARQLQAAGATFIAIACNTAHHWHADIQHAVTIPVLHIADIAVAALRDRGCPPDSAVGLMVTNGTLASGYYAARLERAGFTPIVPAAEVQADIAASILAVKRADLDLARRLASGAARKLHGAGAAILLLGCTELPIALRADSQNPPVLDATTCLAEACVRLATDVAQATDTRRS